MAGIKREYFDKFLSDLHLLQAAILVPKLTNTVELKKNLGIPLSAVEIQQELNNPRSPLYKYLVNMIHACLIFLEAEHEKMQLQQYRQSIREEILKEVMSIEQRLEEASRGHFSEEEKLALEKRITELNLVTALEARKYQELKFWLAIFNDPNDLASQAKMMKIIDERYALINQNLNYFDNLLSRTDLPEEERDRLQDYSDRYHRHLELSSPEYKQKFIAEYLQSSDTALQVARKDLVQEELYRNLILEREKKIDEYSNVGQKTHADLETTGNIHEINKIEDIKPTSKYDKTNNKWSYLHLSEELNGAFEKLFNSNPEVVISSFDKVLKLVDMLHVLKQKREEGLHKIIDEHVNDTLAALIENDSDSASVIVECLHKWKNQQSKTDTKRTTVDTLFSQSNHAEGKSSHPGEKLQKISIQDSDRKEFLQSLEEAKKDRELSNEISLIENMEKSLNKMGDSTDSNRQEIDNLINNFNELIKNYPQNSSLLEIYDKLLSFSFIDKNKIYNPQQNIGADLGL